MQNEEYEHFPVTLIFSVAVSGLIAVVVGIGLQELWVHSTLKYVGTCLLGLGMSVSGGACFRVCIGILENPYKKWRERYIEIFTQRREEEAHKYSVENGRIRDYLALVSVSGGNAFKDLEKEESALFQALNRGAALRLLIINPESTAAEQRAKADNPLAPSKSRSEMYQKFQFLEKLVKKLSSSRPKGKLEVKMTDSPIFTTIYCHQDKLIFGSYFPEKRGGNFGSYSVSKQYNERLYAQYLACFDQEWGKGTDIVQQTNGELETTFRYEEVKKRIDVLCKPAAENTATAQP